MSENATTATTPSANVGMDREDELAEGPYAGGESSTGPAVKPLTPSEFKEYNRLAEFMDRYHAHFRQTWNVLHAAAVSGRRPANMTLKQLVDLGLSFVRQLTMHHDIEETHLYPLLADKMPEFRHARSGNQEVTAEASELIRQHREIHAGLDDFGEYLRKCRSREVDLEMRVLRDKLIPWGGVLWTHMDQEVLTLGAENMRKYWTLDEIRKLSNMF